MKVTRILSVLGATAFASQALAHGDHGSMVVAQLVGHGFTGEHLVTAIGVITLITMATVKVARKS